MTYLRRLLARLRPAPVVDLRWEGDVLVITRVALKGFW